MQFVPIIVVLLGCAVNLVLLVAILSFFRIWLKAMLSGSPVSLAQMLGTRLRGTKVAPLVDSYILAKHADLSVDLRELEIHSLAGGDTARVVRAMAAAKKANVPLTFKEVSAIDLADRDPEAEVSDSIQQWELEFAHIAPDSDAPIEGNSADGARIGASFKVRYRRSPHPGDPKDFPLHAEMAARILSFIGDAQDFAELRTNEQSHEAALLEYGQGLFRTLDAVELVYFEV